MIQSEFSHQPGSSGTPPGKAIKVDQAERIGWRFEVTAIGVTPTCQARLEITLDDDPATATWFSVFNVSNNNDTPQANTGAVTTVSETIWFVVGGDGGPRFATFARVVLDNNTNCTFQSEIYTFVRGRG